MPGWLGSAQVVFDEREEVVLVFWRIFMFASRSE
jgi:hypothetical protein